MIRGEGDEWGEGSSEELQKGVPTENLQETVDDVGYPLPFGIHF